MPESEKRVFGRRSLKESAAKVEHEQHFYLHTIEQHFRPGMRWLDAGCGHSLIPKWVRGAQEIERRFLQEAEMIVGADIDAPSLSVPSSIRRIACNLSSLAFPDATFDLVTCNMVVEHLAQPQEVFGEFFRVLRPDGILVILTPNLYHIANLVSLSTPFWFHRWVLGKLGQRPPEDIFPTLYKCNTRRTMQTRLRGAGFASQTVHMVPGRPRLMKFGPIFYLEYAFYLLSLRFVQLREILCAVAHKAPSAADGAIRSLNYLGGGTPARSDAQHSRGSLSGQDSRLSTNGMPTLDIPGLQGI